MKDKHPHQSELSSAELKLIERLRDHPELMERFQQILELSTSADGSIKKADEIEASLVEELRHLGKLTMESWASGVESALSDQLKQRDPSASAHKKKR